MKVVINGCFGGFSVSREAWLRLRELGSKGARKEADDRYNGFCRDIPRNDPLLIQVVEELGPKANGACAKLEIVEVPDDVEWEIEEYDGSEHVAEAHRTWR